MWTQARSFFLWNSLYCLWRRTAWLRRRMSFFSNNCLISDAPLNLSWQLAKPHGDLGLCENQSFDCESHQHVQCDINLQPTRRSHKCIVEVQSRGKWFASAAAGHVSSLCVAKRHMTHGRSAGQVTVVLLFLVKIACFCLKTGYLNWKDILKYTLGCA